MTMRLAVPIALCCVAAAQVAEARGPSVPIAESSVDRPAIFVGDRVTFTIDLFCPAGIDVLAEDLAPDKLKLTALEAVSSDNLRRDEPDGTRYRFRYVLTTFVVDAPTLMVGPLPVRYYAARAGQRPDQAAPAGVIYVPGASVSFRSLLPESEFADVRDGRTVPPRRARYRALGLLGIALILAAAVPAVVMVAGFVRHLREDRPRRAPGPRHMKRSARAALEELRALDVETPGARRAAFARLDGAVRHHLAQTCAVSTAGLTPEEIAAAIESCDARPPLTAIASILDACERARYAEPARQPTADEWRSALAATGEWLAPER